MASSTMRREEGIGLVVAVALHVLVLVALVVRTDSPDVVKPPERIEVTISDEVGRTSTSPDPFSQAAPDRGPEQGEPAPDVAAPPPPEPAPAPLPPEPRPRDVAPPEPRPEPKPRPQPRPTAKPRPAEKPAPARKPQPRPTPRKPSAIDDIVSKPSTTKAAKPSKSATKATTPPRKAGSSAFDDAFKSGVPGAKSASGSGAPAAAIGPKQVSALNAAISRQLKPHWQAPQGADAELLVTRVRFRLNPDGSLDGEPQVLSTSGQTPANQAQVSRHQEQAVRAVKLAAPFSLPEDLYAGWKVVTTNFDRRLSQ